MPASAVEPPPDMEAYLAQFDAHMDAIATGSPLGDYQITKLATRAVRRRVGSAKLRERDALARKSLRAIYLAGAFHELPEQGRAHPGMQARLRRHAAEVDHAVFGTKQLLRELTPREREQLRQALRRDPGFTLRLAETLDGNAASIDVPQRRRRMFRNVMRNAAWRLRNQPPSLLIDECVEKVERVAKRNGYDEELQRKIAAGVAAKSFWDAADSAGDHFAAGQSSTSSGGWVVAAEPEPAPSKPRRGRGQRTVNTGLWLMGIGLVIGITGVVIAAAGSVVGVFVVSFGVLLLVSGLLALISGAITNALGLGEGEEEEKEKEKEEEEEKQTWDEGWKPRSGAGPPAYQPPPQPPPLRKPPKQAPAPQGAPNAAPPSPAPVGPEAPPAERFPPVDAPK